MNIDLFANIFSIIKFKIDKIIMPDTGDIFCCNVLWWCSGNCYSNSSIQCLTGTSARVAMCSWHPILAVAMMSGC